MPPSDPTALPAPYPPGSGADRTTLAAFARETPLTYGTWGRFKRLYKTVETNPLADSALFGTLAARIDAAALTASDPPQPVALGPGVRGVESLVVIGRQVYCLLRDSSRTQKLAGYEFDPANPLQPVLLGSVDVRDASSLTLCGPFVCLLSGGLETGVLSIFDPAAIGGPRWRGTVALSGYGQAVSASHYIYAAVQGQKSAWSGLRVLDLMDPDQPRIVGEVAIQEAQYVACDGALVAITSGQTRFQWGQIPSASNAGGLHLVDVSAPNRPRQLGVFRRSNISAVALRGRWAFVGVDRTGQNDSAGLCLVDITNPSRPEQRGFFATNYYTPQSITLHGDFAYLTMQYGPPQVVNISRPEAPVAAGHIKTYSPAAIGISEDTAYVGTSYQGLELYNVVNPGKPARIGTPPSGATLGYMKRRVRRTLRNFAKTNSEAYVQLAAATLASSGNGAGFDAARQWVIADILYGGSDRYSQGRHGRGPLVPTLPARRRLRTREERAPQAWDSHWETATALLSKPALPWPIHEAMLKIVLANNTPLPSLSLESLAGFLASPSPLLIYSAVRPLTARLESGEFVPPETAALAYVKTGAARRRLIETFLRRYAEDAPWCRSFAEQIFDLASLHLQNGRLPRRYASACEMVAQRFPAYVPDNLVRAMTASLLTADRPGLTELVLTLARRVSPPEAFDWLQTLQTVGEAQREQVVLALASGLASQAFTLAEAGALVLHYGDEFIRAAGWRLLTASATAPSVFHALWTGLLDSFQETPALKTAMSSPAALLGLARAGLSPQTIADRLRDKPFLAGLLSPETFAAILPTVPASVALSLVAAVAEERWLGFRPFLLSHLRGGMGLAAFWNAAPAALDTDSTGQLERRLLEDSEIADTLSLVDDPSLLAIREPAFDATLDRWVQAHEALFTPNSPLLLQAATHVLPTVRTWALARVSAAGPDLPFALRLLESGLPESVEVGGLFFTSLPTGDFQERSYALALCDSPLAPVRALGRAFVSGRWDTLPREDLLRALFENFHPEMQAFVAEMLGQSSTRPAETARFDGEVLQTRHTARRAKEKVKARQSLEPTVEVATLLALARSRTPRDSEWALGQLTKLALSGQEIEGFTLTGVAGG
jgi:hypothetical protein